MLRAGIGRPHQHLSQQRTGTFVQMRRGVDPFADNACRFSAPRRRHIDKIGPGEEAQRRIGLKSGYQPAYRSEEHTSELQSLMRTSYAVFCLKKKNTTN